MKCATNKGEVNFKNTTQFCTIQRVEASFHSKIGTVSLEIPILPYKNYEITCKELHKQEIMMITTNAIRKKTYVMKSLEVYCVFLG